MVLASFAGPVNSDCLKVRGFGAGKKRQFRSAPPVLEQGRLNQVLITLPLSVLPWGRFTPNLIGALGLSL